MSTAAAAKGPIRPRTRGPIELTLEVTLGLVFVSLFAWFVGLLIEVAGSYTLWKDEGAIQHSRRIVAQDLGYIAAAPRSLLIDDTEAFAKKLIGWVALPYERFGLVRLYQRLNAPEGQAAASGGPEATQKGRKRPFSGLGKATREVGQVASKWIVVSMHVAQDVVLRLSVAPREGLHNLSIFKGVSGYVLANHGGWIREALQKGLKAPEYNVPRREISPL